MFLSSRERRESAAVGVGADLDEGPDAVLAGWDVVLAALEADHD